MKKRRRKVHGNCMNIHCDWYEEGGDYAMIVQVRD